MGFRLTEEEKIKKFKNLKIKFLLGITVLSFIIAIASLIVIVLFLLTAKIPAISLLCIINAFLSLVVINKCYGLKRILEEAKEIEWIKKLF